METTTTVAGIPALDNLEICEQALNTTRKRAQFIKGLAVASASMAAVAAVPAAALAAGSKAVPASDIAILNYALTLEHLEARFYDAALGVVPFEQATVRYLAQTLKADENAHVAALTAAIKQVGGSAVGPAPSYNFGMDTFKTQSAFLKLARLLEDTGVHAYLGQVANIKTTSIVLTAASIVTVEARHAGAIRYQYGLQPTISPFDGGYDMAKVLSIAGPLLGK
jgi:rubrerythrin